MTSAEYESTTVGNRPVARKDAQGNIDPSSFKDTAYLGDEAGGMNVIYNGFSKPGQMTSAAVWKINKVTYSANGNIIAIQWPQNSFGHATANFEFIWDDRASYTYS